ncbi:MAG: hypothetical protein M1824_000931 [Vezdaea acicularis]|nr:MAG: hypothetical protein M1824_000931 [Vezdaea acicularis]
MATKLEKALSIIDAGHAEDPKNIINDGTDVPYELHYARKMSSYLQRLDPNASEMLQIAIRAQHFRRWEVPRSSYPMTRAGYFAWRTFLKKRQATQAEEICIQCGYSDEDAGRVASLIRKEDLKKDEETQTLEDTACLVFLDDQFEDFEKEHDEEKIISIIRKTWAKMSEKGHEEALKIDLSGKAKGLASNQQKQSSDLLQFTGYFKTTMGPPTFTKADARQEATAALDSASLEEAKAKIGNEPEKRDEETRITEAREKRSEADTQDAADKAYEEAIEEEYAKREGGA